MRYRRDIDGLRGVAVLAVVLFHAELGGPGGYLGVDVFFVLSGYLITSILRERRPSLSQFWLGRVRRLFPALALMLAVTLAAGREILTPPEYAELAQSVTAQAFLGANFFFWSLTGYWDGPAQLKPLLHTWSLAVEEQFYLLYPLVLARLGRRLWLLVAISLALALVAPSFYLLPQRAWELALGGLVACWRRPLPGAEWLALTALAGLAAAFAGFVLSALPTLVPCLATAVLLHANRDRLTLAGRLLSTRALVAFGLISYSWYLWHWPVLVFARYLDCPRVPALALGLALGGLSWRFVEQPTRRRPLPTWVYLLGWLVLLGAAQRPPEPTPVERFFVSAREPDWNATTTLPQVQTGRLPRLGEPGPPSVLLWGDSHGLCVRSAVDASAHAARRSGCSALADGTPPVLDYVNEFPGSLGKDSPAYNQAVLGFVRQHHIPAVILAARWNIHADSPAFAEHFTRTAHELQAAGARVWVLKQLPEHPQHIYRALQRAARLGLDPETVGISLATYRAQGEAMDRLLARLPEVRVLDPTPHFFAQGRCRVIRDSVALYCDEDHVTENGAAQLKPLFDRVMTAQ